MSKLIAIFIIITFVSFAFGAWTGKSAIQDGNLSAIYKSMVAMLLFAVPIGCWVIYGFVRFIKHLHFS